MILLWKHRTSANVLLLLNFFGIFCCNCATAAEMRGEAPVLNPCVAAIDAAEREFRLPTGLLMSIGRVESGFQPHVLNIAGRAVFPADKRSAIEAVRSAQAKGVTSIDVGCVQINLKAHPAAFTRLEEAFDPVANARYGAGLLSSLRSSSGTWTSAVAFYHSPLASAQATYVCQVHAVLLDLRRLAPSPCSFAGTGRGNASSANPEQRARSQAVSAQAVSAARPLPAVAADTLIQARLRLADPIANRQALLSARAAQVAQSRPTTDVPIAERFSQR